MKSKHLLLALALGIIMSGCGKIDDTDISSRKAGAAPVDAADTFLGSKPQTETASQQETVSAPNETSSVSESVPESRNGQEEVTVPEPSGDIQTENILTPENISGYRFGFELYNDGHKDCWEQRYECAKLMLEAISQPGTGEKVTDHIPDVEELNSKETDGFMTWLKFEDPMTFRVGDTAMSGSSLNIVDYNGAYYFFIGEIEDIDKMIEFDSSYIPKILAAAGTQPVNAYENTADIDLSRTNMTVTTSHTKYISIEGSEHPISHEQLKEIVYAVLDTISGSMTEAPGRYITEQDADNDPSGFYMLFDFGQPVNVDICGSEREIYVISVGGNISDGYIVNINNESVYDIDESIVRNIKNIIGTG